LTFAGVSIVIPEAAIPEGVQQEIYFKVCRDNNILPPLDAEKGKSYLPLSIRQNKIREFSLQLTTGYNELKY